jgi:hypothetical protein
VHVATHTCSVPFDAPSGKFGVVNIEYRTVAGSPY